VCEVETVARGRAFGRQLTTAQRKAIEDHAVKPATEHFETEGCSSTTSAFTSS